MSDRRILFIFALFLFGLLAVLWNETRESDPRDSPNWRGMYAHEIDSTWFVATTSSGLHVAWFGEIAAICTEVESEGVGWLQVIPFAPFPHSPASPFFLDDPACRPIQ